MVVSESNLIPEMFNSKRFCCFQFPYYSTLSFAVVFLLIICASSFISNLSLHSVVSETRISHVVLEHRISAENNYNLVAEVEDDHDHSQLQPSINATAQERISWFKKVLPKFEILKLTKLSRKFEARVEEFLGNNQCRIQFFMTWISPASSFGEREFFTVESLFRAHPKGCLVILSRTLDTAYGYRVLKPLVDFGIKILAVTPNLPFLFKDTAVELWFQEIIKGKIDPGEIPFSQNLSNLIRLAVLYKYGGVYLDTDFITLNDFSTLRNSIGAQSVDLFGKWTRLNNAVLIFDKRHQLLHKFLEEFASTFDGNKWGHNGPYLVSRVVQRIPGEKNDFNFTVLPPMAFYPVDWTRIEGFFKKPINHTHFKWVEAKLIQLNKMTYGVHLWNRQSSGLRIEDGSVISRLISSNHIIGKPADVSKKF